MYSNFNFNFWNWISFENLWFRGVKYTRQKLPRNNIRFNFSGKTSNEIIFWEILVGEKKFICRWSFIKKVENFCFCSFFVWRSCQRFEALFHPAYSSQSFRQKLSTLIEIQLKIVHKLMKIIFLNSNNISFVINSSLIFFEKTTFCGYEKINSCTCHIFVKIEHCVVCKQNSSSVGDLQRSIDP